MNTPVVHRPRRAIAALALILTMASAATLMSTSSAGAAGYTPNANWIDTTCKLGQLNINVGASVSLGYTNGQYIAYRYNLQSNRGHNITSGWSANKVVPFNNYAPGFLGRDDLGANFSTQWWVQVQIVRYFWNGYAWTTSYTPWIRSVYTGYAGSRVVNCLT